jgi:hypothetical protein
MKTMTATPALEKSTHRLNKHKAILLVSFLEFASAVPSTTAAVDLVGTEATGTIEVNNQKSTQNKDAYGVCRGFDFGGEVIDGYFVQHGGRKAKVRIPVDYLMFPEAGTSFTERSAGEANLNFHRDTLKPYPRQQMQGKIVAGKEEWVSVLVANLIEIEAIATAYTHSFSGRKLNSNDTSFAELLAFKDLYKIQFEPTWEKKSLYVGRSDSIITDVIACDAPGPGRYPHCQQITKLQGYDVKIGYPLKELAAWKSIREKVEDLLACMTK